MRFKPITQFDTPSYVSNVKVNGANYDCTGYTLTLVFKGPEDTVAASRAATWTAIAVGAFSFKFDPADLDAPGTWEGAFKLTKDTDVIHEDEDFKFTVKPRL
jgi:hypothetical protein